VRLFRRLSTLENVTVADQRSRGEHPLAAAVWPLIGGRHERENILRARDHLDFVGLADRADKPAKWLSFGQQKLLAISRLLNCGAQCMLLDEPTAGLSPNMVAQVVSTIRALANKNRTIVVVEHNLTVVRALCDWAYIMDDGNITARVRADEIAQRLGRNASGIAASESPPSQPRE